MDDLCTLAQFHADDLSTHAVSLAILARALNDAHESGGFVDRQAFHRAADLALTLYGEEKRRFASVDSPAPLLDTLYLKAFVEPEASEDTAPESEMQAIGKRFHAEVMRLLYRRTPEAERTLVEADALSRSR
jgi:hypothetical protein